MKTTIDGAGRIVIPKAVRVRLGLAAGEPLDLRERDGYLEIEPEPTAMTLIRRKGGVVAVPHKRRLPILSDEIVRETLERSRR